MEAIPQWLQIVLLFVVWIYLARIHSELVRIGKQKKDE